LQYHTVVVQVILLQLGKVVGKVVVGLGVVVGSGDVSYRKISIHNHFIIIQKLDKKMK